jgi:hypothetical protein
MLAVRSLENRALAVVDFMRLADASLLRNAYGDAGQRFTCEKPNASSRACRTQSETDSPRR